MCHHVSQYFRQNLDGNKSLKTFLLFLVGMFLTIPIYLPNALAETKQAFYRPCELLRVIELGC